MELQTKITLQKQARHTIDYHSNVLLLGSCFTENVGNKLEYFKFKNLINPVGILFQPLAIENLILRAINNQMFTEEDIFFFNERWHSFAVHSSLSSTSKEELIEQLNSALQQTQERINEATHVVITLGTSWVYRHIETDTIVANCHKIPQKKFHKELLSVDQIEETLAGSIALLKSVNPKLINLLTVSPVRHLKDGFIENSRSKAHLISAVQNIVDPRQNVHYFPAYEIMMDQLRDYRFYNEDMIHPNQTAINYIWDCFQEVWVDEKAYSTMKSVQEIQKGLQHKPFNFKGEQHQTFLNKLAEKQALVKQEFPHIVF